MSSRYSMEAINLEVERMFLGKVKNLNQLKNAKVAQRIEQWEIRSKITDNPTQGGGILRVRCYDKKRYEMCLKKFPNQEGKSGSLEKEFAIDEETFKMFRALAPSGTIKTRYIFPIAGTDLKWEVDVFEGKGGLPQDWVKIDLETSQQGGKLPEFPLEFDILFEVYPKAGNLGKNTEEQMKMKEHLFNNVFQTKNEFHIGEIELPRSVEGFNMEKEEEEDDAGMDEPTEGDEGAAEEGADSDDDKDDETEEAEDGTVPPDAE